MFITLSSKNDRRYSKKCAKESVSILIGLYVINCDDNEAENEMKMKINHIYTTWIGPDLDMDTNILNIKSVGLRWWLYISTNT